VQRALEQAAQLTAEKVTWEGGNDFEIHWFFKRTITKRLDHYRRIKY
jgi:hypothetical protein